MVRSLGLRQRVMAQVNKGHSVEETATLVRRPFTAGAIDYPTLFASSLGDKWSMASAPVRGSLGKISWRLAILKNSSPQ